MRLVHWLVTAPVALVLIIFAVSNREKVDIAFWPFSETARMPLFLIVLGSLLVGFLAGELVAWIGAGRRRREARAQRRQIEALERELAATQAQLSATQGSSPQVLQLPRD